MVFLFKKQKFSCVKIFDNKKLYAQAQKRIVHTDILRGGVFLPILSQIL